MQNGDHRLGKDGLRSAGGNRAHGMGKSEISGKGKRGARSPEK